MLRQALGGAGHALTDINAITHTRKTLVLISKRHHQKLPQTPFVERAGCMLTTIHCNGMQTRLAREPALKTASNVSAHIEVNKSGKQGGGNSCTRRRASVPNHSSPASVKLLPQAGERRNQNVRRAVGSRPFSLKKRGPYTVTMVHKQSVPFAHRTQAKKPRDTHDVDKSQRAKHVQHGGSSQSGDEGSGHGDLRRATTSRSEVRRKFLREQVTFAYSDRSSEEISWVEPGCSRQHQRRRHTGKATAEPRTSGCFGPRGLPGRHCDASPESTMRGPREREALALRSPTPGALARQPCGKAAAVAWLACLRVRRPRDLVVPLDVPFPFSSPRASLPQKFLCLQRERPASSVIVLLLSFRGSSWRGRCLGRGARSAGKSVAQTASARIKTLPP
ncbi:hypothetical protein HPB48_012450 [Haemaphysalis longicornis]|uniref:Uncharacterized protein n=1 Tax=Haemaphysalis longicornis TaxID=44386 RepID=A0A9J6G0P3_HAELO|nr:hypothetical protein HPB48_012450 [Haemaphysalis longicornis]